MSRARLEFARAEGRTRLLRQYVGYPFHLTRPFYFEPARPDLATIYLQSCSGGLYRGERLELEIVAGEKTALEVTTQAATLVRDTRGERAEIATRLRLEKDSLALHTPDLLVLFAHAEMTARTEVTLAAGARALCQEGVCLVEGAASGRYASEFLVRDGQGRVLVAERGEIDLATLGTRASPLGPWRAAGAVFLIEAADGGAAALAPDAFGADLMAAIAATGCIAGRLKLPNDAGSGLRLLAGDGGRLARGLALARAAGFQALTGFHPAARRK